MCSVLARCTSRQRRRLGRVLRYRFRHQAANSTSLTGAAVATMFSESRTGLDSSSDSLEALQAGRSALLRISNHRKLSCCTTFSSLTANTENTSHKPARPPSTWWTLLLIYPTSLTSAERDEMSLLNVNNGHLEEGAVALLLPGAHKAVHHALVPHRGPALARVQRGGARPPRHLGIRIWGRESASRMQLPVHKFQLRAAGSACSDMHPSSWCLLIQGRLCTPAAEAAEQDGKWAAAPTRMQHRHMVRLPRRMGMHLLHKAASKSSKSTVSGSPAGAAAPRPAGRPLSVQRCRQRRRTPAASQCSGPARPSALQAHTPSMTGVVMGEGEVRHDRSNATNMPRDAKVS